MILVALQPLKGLDYSKASTFMQLENDNICSVPEFIGVAVRMKRKIYDVIIGTLYEDEDADKELAKWCRIANVLNSLKGARMGLMGHTMEAMYDMHADPTAVAAAFGVHVPLLEVDDVVEVYNTVKEDEIQAKIKVIDAEFDMPDPKSDPVTLKLTDEDKYQAAKTAVALDKFIEKYNLTGLAYLRVTNSRHIINYYQNIVGTCY
jgi:L-arabinose isomerase